MKIYMDGHRNTVLVTEQHRKSRYIPPDRWTWNNNTLTNKPMSPILKVSLGFANGMPDNTLITFCRNVHTLLYSLPDYTDIPVPAAELLARIEAFAAAKAAQQGLGPAGTAAKDAMRLLLLVPMRTLAAYVQENCGNDLGRLLNTGFLANSSSRSRYALSKPSILKITNGMSGEALVTISTESVARGSEIRAALIDEDNKPGEFMATVFSTSSRNIVVPNLIPGRLYLYQGRTLGGTTTYSDWSDPSVQRAS